MPSELHDFEGATKFAQGDGIKRRISTGKVPGFTEDEEGILWYKGRLCLPVDSELK